MGTLWALGTMLSVIVPCDGCVTGILRWHLRPFGHFGLWVGTANWGLIKSGSKYAMASVKSNFTCPSCGALYYVIKIEAGPESDNREITCRACGAPLFGREGKFVLKYFLQRRRDNSGVHPQVGPADHP
jgi:hypothetical protein